jgi:hypothetical protein
MSIDVRGLAPLLRRSTCPLPSTSTARDWASTSSPRTASPRRVPIASISYRRYHRHMAKAKEFNLNNPFPIREKEDQETLAAIDEGIRDADAGRTTPIANVRKLLFSHGYRKSPKF